MGIGKYIESSCVLFTEIKATVTLLSSHVYIQDIYPNQDNLGNFNNTIIHIAPMILLSYPVTPKMVVQCIAGPHILSLNVS
jgi:hypothetical protein